MVAAVAVATMADTTDRNFEKLEIKPTETASPNVNRDNNCHFRGDRRRESAEDAMKNQHIIDNTSDTSGTVEPKPGRRIHEASDGCVPNRTTEKAVIINCTDRIAYTRAKEIVVLVSRVSYCSHRFIGS